MTRLIAIAALAITACGTAAQAGFVLPNGNVQFPNKTLPQDPDRKHPSLTERSDKARTKAPGHANAWAPHIQGPLEAQK